MADLTAHRTLTSKLLEAIPNLDALVREALSGAAKDVFAEGLAFVGACRTWSAAVEMSRRRPSPRRAGADGYAF